jgi:TonB family protein
MNVSFDFAINPAHAKFLTIDARTADGQQFYLPVGDLPGSDLSLPFGDCQVSRKAKVTYHCTLGPDYTFSQQLKEPPNPAQRDEKSQRALLIRAVTPIYPQLAKSARAEGTVRFSANIGFDGKVERLALIDSTGPGSVLLVQAAQDAIKQWIFAPFTKNGQPVPVVTTVTVSFSLQIG